MDLGILIAALSLLVAALAEGRSIWRAKKEDERLTSAILLLQLLQCLDNIINTGSKLIAILSEIPISDERDKTRFVTLKKKKEILEFIKQQFTNLKVFSKIYNSNLLPVNPKASVKLHDAITFFVPDKTKWVPHLKGRYLEVLTWKLLDGEHPFSKVHFLAGGAISSYVESIEIDDRLTFLTLKFPTKIEIQETASVKQTEIYDLKKPRDLRQLLSKAKEQMDEIKLFRKKLAEEIKTNITLAEILASK